MSLIFKISHVLTRRPAEDAEELLRSKGLKTRYGNIKALKVDAEGWTIYKQRSKTKTENPKTVSIEIDGDRYVGVF